MQFRGTNIELPRWRAPAWRTDEPERRRTRASIAALPIVAGISAGLGALALYLFDPDRGRARRAQARDRLAATARHFGDRAGRGSRYIGTTVSGKAKALAASRNGHERDESMNDAALAHHVESDLFRDRRVPKGKIDINAEKGTVVLRGTVESESQRRSIESRVAKISGVTDVRNLLHLEGTPAPTSRGSSTSPGAAG